MSTQAVSQNPPGAEDNAVQGPSPTDSIFDQPDTDAAEAAAEQESGPSAESEGAEETGEALAEGAAETEGEETDEWLPSEQDKVFSDDVLLRYAKRYQKDDKWLADPLNRQLLIDKINSDIEIRSRKAQGEEAEEEPTLEDEPEEGEEPQKQPETLSFEQLDKTLDQFVKPHYDPAVGKWITEGLSRAYAIKDPEQRSEAVWSILTKGAVNVLRTFGPMLIFGDMGNGRSLADQWLEGRYSGFGDFWQGTERQRAWDAVRGQTDKAGKPAYANLPAYGTPQFNEAIQKVAEIVPGFEHFHAKDPKTGKLVSPYQNFLAKAKIAARILTQGDRQAVQMARQGVETGLKLAQKQAAQRAAGRLGTGQSPSKGVQGKGADPILDDLDAAIASANDVLSPFPRK